MLIVPWAPVKPSETALLHHLITPEPLHHEDADSSSRDILGPNPTGIMEKKMEATILLGLYGGHIGASYGITEQEHENLKF